jgi:hypothetical protein
MSAQVCGKKYATPLPFTPSPHPSTPPPHPLNEGAPPLSMTPVANFATGTAGVVDTGCKFATGVNDTSGKFAIVIDTGVNGNNIRLLTS